MSGKPKIWSFDRETEVVAVDRNVRRPDHRQVCYAVVDAVLEIRETGQVLDRHIQAFTCCLECGNQYVFCTGGRRLAQCAHFDEKCAEHIPKLMGHPKWRVRLNVVAVTDYSPPEPILLSVLRLGLSDRSKRVRELAASKAVLRRLEVLTPDLERCRRDEKHEAVRTGLDDAIRLIRGERIVRNGVTTALEPDKDGAYRLISRTPRRFVSDSLSGAAHMTESFAFAAVLP